MSEIIEKILSLLETGETYSRDSISIEICVPKDYVEKIINFLKNFKLVDTDEKMEKIILCQEFREFLLKVK